MDGGFNQPQKLRSSGTISYFLNGSTNVEHLTSMCPKLDIWSVDNITRRVQHWVNSNSMLKN